VSYGLVSATCAHETGLECLNVCTRNGVHGRPEQAASGFGRTYADVC